MLTVLFLCLRPKGVHEFRCCFFRLDTMKFAAKSMLQLIDIEALSCNQVKTLLCSYLSPSLNPDHFSESVSNAIYKRCNGNPLYAIEMIKTLKEQGWVQVRGDACVVKEGLLTESGDIPIPDTLHGILTSRIDLLDPGCQNILKLASVIGNTYISEPVLR